jgi:hypothetical protein
MSTSICLYLRTISALGPKYRFVRKLRYRLAPPTQYLNGQGSLHSPPAEVCLDKVLDALDVLTDLLVDLSSPRRERLQRLVPGDVALVDHGCDLVKRFLG